MYVSRSWRLAAFVALALIGAACVDRVPTGPLSPNPPAPPLPPQYSAQHLVHVDIAAREVRVEPVGAAGSSVPGVAGRIYGSPAQIKYHIDFPAVGPDPDPEDPTKVLYSLTTRLENLLPFAVGTHVTVNEESAPRDTMGVFVFVAIPPLITEGCEDENTLCAVQVANQHGRGNFTGLSQDYWYWREILHASDGEAGSGPDMSDEVTWTFRADAEVTNFVFGVSVSAPWSPPNFGSETSWNVGYAPDSLPWLGSEPVWRPWQFNAGASAASIVSGGCHSESSRCLRMDMPMGMADSGRVFATYRADSLGVGQDAFMHALLLAAPGSLTDPVVFMGMQDEYKFIEVGISVERLGFVDSLGSWVGSYHPLVWSDTEHEIRLVKFADDSVKLWHNGDWVLHLAYPDLPDVPALNLPHAWPKPTFWFGVGSAPQKFAFATTAQWSHVVYEIGSTGEIAPAQLASRGAVSIRSPLAGQSRRTERTNRR